MFENDYPLLSTANLIALILHRAAAGPITLDSCETALAVMFRQANETPELPAEALRERLAGHLRDLQTARLMEPEPGGGLRLTMRGRDALNRHPEGLDQTDLAKYPEFATLLRNRARMGSRMDPREDSYEEGFRARLNGAPFTANPYAFDNIDHLSWENGWTEARENQT